MALSGGQKLCLWIIIVAALAIITGSVSPFWSVIKVGSLKAMYGVWYACTDFPKSECKHYRWGNYSADDFKAWFYVFHVLTGLSTLVSVAVVLMALSKVCSNNELVKNVTGLGVSAGAMGIAAFVVFHTKTLEAMAVGLDNDFNDWSAYVFVAGSGLLALCSVGLSLMPNEGPAFIAPVGRPY